MNVTLHSLAETLKQLPQASVEDIDPDGFLLLRIGQRKLLLHLVASAAGYPRDIRAALLRAKSQTAHGVKNIFAAPALTPNSRQMLQQEGESYVDAQGNIFILADGIYILKESLPGSGKVSRSGETNIFQGRATQILQTLLHFPGKAWHITDLISEANVAAGTALKVCDSLENMLLLTREGRGPKSVRRLEKPGDLLDLWAANHRLERYQTHRYYRWISDLTELVPQIGDATDDQGASYALTLAMGTTYRAPLLTHTDQLALFVSHTTNLAELAKRCRLTPAEEGSNVVIYVDKYDYPLMYRQKIENIWIANDIQLYLDLMNFPARGKEQAEHLRRERIKF